MAESNPEIEIRPDVEPGALVFLDNTDLRNRFIFACCVVDDFLAEAGIAEGMCEEHFCDLVSEVVLRVMRCTGIVDFSLDPEYLGQIYALMREGIAQVS